MQSFLGLLLLPSALSLSAPNRAFAVDNRATVPFTRRDVAGLSVAAVGLSLGKSKSAEAVSGSSASGVSWEDVTIGANDATPAEGATLTLDFTGRLDGFDGRIYNRSPKGGVKLDLGSGKAPPGLEEALLAPGLRVGGIRRVVVPAAVAYGKTGFPTEGEDQGKLVPPDSTLYYEIRLRSVALKMGLGFGLNFF